MSEATQAQRIRLTFAKGEPVKYIAHLAVMRAWERIIRRADLPIGYSQGFNPRPKLTFASALPVGYMGQREVLDLELRTWVAPDEVLRRVRAELPPGFALHTAHEVPLKGPSLQSQVRYAVYRVSFAAHVPAVVLQQQIARLLHTATLPRERTVKGKVRAYDLRPLIHTLCYSASDGTHVTTMVLANMDSGTARVDEVVAEMGLLADMRAVHRTRLLFAEDALETKEDEL